MKTKSFLALGLLGISSFCCANEQEIAWQKTNPDQCKKDSSQNMDQCKKDADQCKKDAAAKKNSCADGDTKCQQDANKMADKCTQDQDKCKQNNKDDLNKCQQDAAKKNESSFRSSLNSANKDKFDQFSNSQKMKAMDMADNNKMSPDQAVTKMSGM